MFTVGDNVVYPGHGAGKVKDVSRKTILNEEQFYFVIFFPLQKITLSLPEKTIQESGLRPANTQTECDSLLASLSERDPVDEFPKPSGRQDERLRSGSMDDCADVFFELTCKKTIHQKLHMQEKKSLELSRKLLISELMLVHDASETEAANMLDSPMDALLKERL
ncbi:CarD family transcriptional regulator [Alkalicoccus luteus]|uniref:CarD family transcriptional regulator n=1 Tax=Alkalicoccus luteus TaxID=1237094 RepID=A0A969PTN8_9BACI|nr:CarD family transcriptional regulator [Alkalicoccus luteus]NJP37698.1 CarD family transcriptional regulator [Alkalicoccus luteus]